MVQLADRDILTREVLEWTGVHLFHNASSSCSQKTRIVLNAKRVEWVAHPIELSGHIGRLAHLSTSQQAKTAEG